LDGFQQAYDSSGGVGQTICGVSLHIGSLNDQGVLRDLLLKTKNKKNLVKNKRRKWFTAVGLNWVWNMGSVMFAGLTTGAIVTVLRLSRHTRLYTDRKG